MPTNDELTRWDTHHFWHAFTQMGEYESLVIDRAEGFGSTTSRGTVTSTA